MSKDTHTHTHKLRFKFPAAVYIQLNFHTHTHINRTQNKVPRSLVAIEDQKKGQILFGFFLKGNERAQSWYLYTTRQTDTESKVLLKVSSFKTQ